MLCICWTKIVHKTQNCTVRCCSTVLRFGAAVRCCSTVLQDGAAVRCCSTHAIEETATQFQCSYINTAVRSCTYTLETIWFHFDKCTYLVSLVITVSQHTEQTVRCNVADGCT